MIKTAIIGYGQSGKLSHAYGMQASDSFKIVAACDTHPENRKNAANDLNCPVYENYSEMLEKEDLDLVAIVTRSDTHATIACDCLNSGVHIVVTKPWALNQKEARIMIAAQEASGKIIFPWIPTYWAPDYNCISNLLAEKAIGDVFLIRRYHSDFRHRDDWQTEKQYGGGYLLNWGMHVIQPIIGLANSKVKRVFGQLQQTINSGDADDNFMAVLEFENGIRGVGEFTESIHRFPAFIIQGTRGTITSDGETVTVQTADPCQPEEITTQTIPLKGKQFGDEADIYHDIADNLLEGKPFLTPPKLALEGTVVLDAVSQSHETRQTVDIF